MSPLIGLVRLRIIRILIIITIIVLLDLLRCVYFHKSANVISILIILNWF